MPITLNPNPGPAGDLITSAYLTSALAAAGISVTAAVTAVQPTLISAASDVVRRFCGNRDFVRRTYTDEYTPALDGSVMLRQLPVNQVLKVEGTRDVALVLSFSPTAGQSAWVAFTTAGDFASGTLAHTGLRLSSVTNGAQTDTALAFATYPTLSQLSAAVNAVTGWTATTGGSYTAWPSTSLITADVAQGALASNGCELEVYSEVLSGCTFDPRTGRLATGRRHLSPTGGPLWGPDWQIFDDAETDPRGAVRVTYDAGFDTVPLSVQQATAEACIDLLNLLSLDQRLSSETVGEYSYVRDAALSTYVVTPSVAGKLARYVIHWA